IFPAEGKFRVCLTAYNVDSVSTCNDVKCDTVKINPQEDCHALFTAELDTLNPAPNTFFFIYNSTGDADRFLWTFDDGATYDTRNVVHRFQTDGPHEACLAIKKEVHGEIVCSDTLCQTVTTAKYYNIGGHLFAGAFPINNPVSTGDTGVAYLYRIDAGKLIPCGISKFVQYGYYTFPKMLSGSYLIKAALTPWSVHYSKYFPSYYHKTLFWKEANFLNLADSNAYVSDIHLLPVNDSLSGPGVLAGTVQKAYSKNSVEEMPFTQIILYDGQLTPVRFTVSGKSGQFEFDNLPYGTYYLYVEYPGKYSRLTTVWLDSATPVISNLQLEVFNHDVTSVPDVTLITVVAGDLFPNPAINEVNLNIDLAADAPMKFDVRTLTGLSVWSGTRKCMAGSNLITIPVASLKSGLYLLKIIGSDGSPITVKKLVKH
ncbi:MAG: carboxypeptidase regulatory-like domain-containing protein, partial [Bacteroidetes bacterium]|nr:carboxypeptidase regulatory-like domain-containing protein [Bacteroidota bacterium]